MDKDNKKNNIDIRKYIDFKEIKHTIISIIEFLVFPAILYVLLESIKYNSILSYFDVFTSILNVSEQYIIVPYIIMLSVMLLLRSIIKNPFVANCVGTVLFFLITMISYYKYITLKQPFIPSDIFLAKNLNQISSFGFSGFSAATWFSISNILILLILDYLLNSLVLKKENNVNFIYKRIIYIVISVVVIWCVCISTTRYVDLGIKNDNGDNYYWMGANAVFFMHLGDFYSEAPENYNKETIENIEKQYINETVEGSDTENPNVILIMNESFADLTKLQNITYSEDPMQLLREIEKDDNCISGNIISPVLGGGTSLPEFEVLTGLSSYFIQQQIYPYTSYIHSDMNSIVREFNKYEYTTIGIHTNTRTFYNRENIYKYLGFQKTLFSEDMEKPEYRGNYISDNEAADRIIEQFQDNTGKKFIFTVTMQNHMKYTTKKYEDSSIEIYSEILTEKEKLELKNYSEGIKDASKMYNKLVEYLKTSDEPTVLIMFGDHLPLLGDSYCSTYVKGGYNKNSINYYTTPYIMWANYNMRELEEVPLTMGTSRLGLSILDIANIENKSWYLKHFEKLYNEYPVINNRFIIDKNGIIMSKVLEEDKRIVDECRALQYDILMKKKYIKID